MNNSHFIYKQFPDEIITIIYSFMPYQQRVTLNKTNYIANHNCLVFPTDNLETFIRKVVRKDVSLVFDFHLHKNINRWVMVMKNYRYKNLIYNNYLKFLDAYCVMHESTNCRNTIIDMVFKYNLGNNWHKNNRIRNIKWSN